MHQTVNGFYSNFHLAAPIHSRSYLHQPLGWTWWWYHSTFQHWSIRNGNKRARQTNLYRVRGYRRWSPWPLLHYTHFQTIHRELHIPNIPFSAYVKGVPSGNPLEVWIISHPMWKGHSRSFMKPVMGYSCPRYTIRLWAVYFLHTVDSTGEVPPRKNPYIIIDFITFQVRPTNSSSSTTHGFTAMNISTANYLISTLIQSDVHSLPHFYSMSAWVPRSWVSLHVWWSRRYHPYRWKFLWRQQGWWYTRNQRQDAWRSRTQ